MKKLFTTIAMLLVLALAAPVMAEGYGNKDKEKCGESKQKYKKGGYSSKMLQELDLTDDQKAEIKTLRKAFWTDNREQLKAAWQNRRHMAQLSYAESVDQAKLEALIEAASESYAAQMVKRAELNSAVFSVLTTEKQQQFEQKMASYQEKRHSRQNLSLTILQLQIFLAIPTGMVF